MKEDAMNCKEVERRAAALAEGLLTEEERAELETHIRHCARCRSVSARVAELVGELTAARTTGLSLQFWPRLRRRLQAHDAARAERFGRWAGRRRRLRPVLASACILIGIWTGIELGNAYALRQSATAVEAPAYSTPQDPVFYPEVLEGLPADSLSALLIFDPPIEGAGRSR